MNRHPGSSARERGFTLIELLITVGIIAVLIAILVPVLSRARAHANVVRCLSHERQLMQAIISYAADNEGYLPPPNWDGGVAVDPITHIDPITHQLHLAGWLYDPGKTSAGHFQQTDAKTGVLYPYLNSLDIYRCTIDDGNWGPNTVQVISSYIMNGAVCDFGDHGLPDKLGRFRSTAILLWEIPANVQNVTGQVNDGANWPSEEITTRHFHGSTVGFVDGHAELKTWNDFVYEWFYNGPGMLWCAPKYPDGGMSKNQYPQPSPPPEPSNAG